MRRVVIAFNAAITGVIGAGLLPLALLYPGVAAALSMRGSRAGWIAGTVQDAALCFGPLLLPVMLLVSGSALQSAHRREPGATARNVAAITGWTLIAAGGAWVVTIG